MGSTTAVKGMDLTSAMAGARTSGGRQTDRMDEGSFQKLLNSKAEEDAGTRQTKDTKGEDKKEVTKDSDSKKPEAADKPEETEASEDTALEQAQAEAALLFQMNPEMVVVEEMPEEVQLTAEIGAVSTETAAVLEPLTEEPVVQTEQNASNLTEVSKEVLETGLKPEQTVSPKETKEEQPKTRTGLEKPKETVKTEVREEVKAETVSEQPLQSLRPETQRAERTETVREVPVEHVRVQEPEEIPEKLLDQLLVKTTAGVKEFEIQLEPYDLGKIIIKAAFGKESTSISIVCTEQRTMELMAKNARDLGAIMEENLGTPTTIVVEDKENGYLEQQNQNNQGGQGQSQEEGSGKQNQKDQEKEGMDFLQQLRLGLI